MFLSSLWHVLFFTALLSAGLLAFSLITRLERTVAVRANLPKLRRRSLLLTALGLALATLPFDLSAAHRLWLPPAAALLIAPPARRAPPMAAGPANPAAAVGRAAVQP